jgi:hypothetical protein
VLWVLQVTMGCSSPELARGLCRSNHMYSVIRSDGSQGCAKSNLCSPAQKTSTRGTNHFSPALFVWTHNNPRFSEIQSWQLRDAGFARLNDSHSGAYPHHRSALTGEGVRHIVRSTRFRLQCSTHPRVFLHLVSGAIGVAGEDEGS